MTLRTPRLLLRPFAVEDVDALHALWTDAAVRRYLWDDVVIERTTAAEVVAASITDYEAFGVGMWVVTEHGNPAVIGFCGFRQFGERAEWELLYGLLPEFWGQGLAVEASMAALTYAFDRLPVSRIAGRTDPPNAASIRVLEKLGMRHAGVTIEHGRETVCYWFNRMNKQILLAARPTGFPKESDFQLVETPVQSPGEGEFLVAASYLSLDPYMRGRMNEARSYADPVQIGEVMTGGVVGKVVQSKNDRFAEGDYVVGQFAWQQYAISDGKGVRKVDPAVAPISTSLGVLGMPGLTAYFGLLEVSPPKAGETVVVSGAAGAVGSFVGQLARIHGCRVVGIAGTDDKIKWITEELGFDAAFNYKTSDPREKLKELCPNGIDVYFDNVGGSITDAVFTLLNPRARVSICGQIALYNLEKPDTGPRLLPQILTRQVKVEGFLVFQFAARYAKGLEDLAKWVKEGKLIGREDIAHGIENAPAAFIGMLQGKNTGKQLVKI